MTDDNHNSTEKHLQRFCFLHSVVIEAHFYQFWIKKLASTSKDFVDQNEPTQLSLLWPITRAVSLGQVKHKRKHPKLHIFSIKYEMIEGLSF